MKPKKTQPRKQSSPKKIPGSKDTRKDSGSDLLTRLEKYLVDRKTRVLYILLGVASLFSILLFDVKISEGNDDALYIEGGFRYAENFTGYYFTANAPLYPIFLSVLIKIFGLQLILFKLFNVVFFVTHILLLFKALNKRIPMTVLVPVLLLTSVNSYFLYFASQTYTESLFVFLQAVFLYVFLSFYDRLSGNQDLKSTYKGWLVLGLTVFLLTFCKNIAVASIGALVLFFLFEKKYLPALFTVGGFLAIKLPFEGIKKLVWGEHGQYGSQIQILLQKDPYNPLKGNEDVSGFIQRFIDNFGIYVSKRFYQILAFRSPDETTTKTILSILFIALTVLGVYFVFKRKNKALTIIALYTTALLGLTFIVLQKRWDQPRFIMVYTPFILMIFFYGLYSLVQKKGFFAQMFYVIVVTVFVSSSALSSVKKSVSNFGVLKKNLAGDFYHGYTNDWVNYLRMSEWCGKNLPEGSFVACRKAPMSFVYGNGMKFYPVYSVPAVDPATNVSNPDSVLTILKRDSVTHVILANLRRNPKKVDGYIINTMHRMIQPVAKKYPGKLELVHQQGESEPAYLYKIKY